LVKLDLDEDSSNTLLTSDVNPIKLKISEKMTFLKRLVGGVGIFLTMGSLLF